jgi:hypothetical protein
MTFTVSKYPRCSYNSTQPGEIFISGFCCSEFLNFSESFFSEISLPKNSGQEMVFGDVFAAKIPNKCTRINADVYKTRFGSKLRFKTCDGFPIFFSELANSVY